MTLFSTYTERHAAILGLVTGVVAAVAGAPELLVGVVATVLGLAEVARSRALRELRREPWYGLGMLAVGYVGTVVVA